MSEVKKPTVSVIMPLLNEEKYVADCVESLLKQDYPRTDMEWIFVDGMSKDKTVAILEDYQRKYPELIQIYSNPNQTAPYAMNIGIRHAVGKYIIRLDAHADYPSDYLSKCVHYLDTTDSDNVGGLAETKAKTSLGALIAKMLSSKFGVGNSQFRTGGKTGYVDTVPFGAFRREVFEKWGLFDERLARNEDNEINYRIRKNGRKVLLVDDIHFTYYCRDTLKGICNMAKNNGKWNIIVLTVCPGSMGIRHYVPLAFLLSLLFLPLFGLLHPAFWWLLLCELGLYFLLDLLFSVKLTHKPVEILTLLFLFPAFHLSYGFGSLLGIFGVLSGKYKNKKN